MCICKRVADVYGYTNPKNEIEGFYGIFPDLFQDQDGTYKYCSHARFPGQIALC